jgi:hypothetical protein
VAESPTAATDELARIDLLRFPVQIRGRAQQNHEGLMREFALIANPHPASEHDIPVRLLRIVVDLRDRYGGFTNESSAELDAAAERGDEEMDLTLLVPAAARGAAVELTGLLEEADDYCRRGELLTLATPPELVAFRNWYLGQVVEQIDGRPPTPCGVAGPHRHDPLTAAAPSRDGGQEGVTVGAVSSHASRR